jgi:hypothetical protein
MGHDLSCRVQRPPAQPTPEGAFRIGEVTIGVPGWQPSKDLAKEEAAQSALGWLNQYGYH